MLVYLDWTDTATANTCSAQGVTGRWQDAIRGHRARSSGGQNTSTVVRVSGMQWPPLQSVSRMPSQRAHHVLDRQPHRINPQRRPITTLSRTVKDPRLRNCGPPRSVRPLTELGGAGWVGRIEQAKQANQAETKQDMTLRQPQQWPPLQSVSRCRPSGHTTCWTGNHTE